jgi:hypothetical protein
LRKIKVEEVAKITIQKVAAAKSREAPVTTDQNPAAGPGPRVGKLQIKKKFTEQERDEYLDEAFEVVATFFEDTLADLASQNPGFSGKFKRVTANHFTAVIYQDGEKVAQCGIRLGNGVAFNNQIVYSSDPSSTNSMNEGVSVTDDGKELFLKSTGMSGMLRSEWKDRLTPHDAAEQFWRVLTWRLQQ